MDVVAEILNRPELVERPPVLVDVGASAELHPKWRRLAKHSICVAFDADERDVDAVAHAARKFRQLHVYNALVAEEAAAATHFHLTRSPYCSSRLPPRQEALADYAFAPLFAVDDVVELRAVDLPSVLRELGLERVDWLKIDSQGTDLRLLASLGELVPRLLVVELEPGLIDAYEGEDKLADVLRYLDEHPFWLSAVRLQGSQRLPSALAEQKLSRRERQRLSLLLEPAPGWAEVECFNDCKDPAAIGKRELLLGFAFATLRRQHGFALELAVRGQERFGDAFFARLEREALRNLRRGLARGAGRALLGRLA